MEKSGLATGIGSLPHRNAEDAVNFIFKYLPNIPFWPQLPKRDFREGMIVQYSENFPGLKVTADGLFFDSSNIENELEEFYGRIISGDLDYFKISRDFAEGFYAFYDKLKTANLKNVAFLKCHITGPFTFSAGINNKDGVAVLHDEVYMQAVIKGLVMKAQWQIKLLREFGRKIIIFIDEPYLSAFGSAYTPISKEKVVKLLGELSGGLVAEDILIGVHCCGNTDWSILTDTPGIDIISFDAFGFIDKLALYADNLKAFFARGGNLCWGIVPTQDSPELYEPDYFVDRIEAGINVLEKKGLDKKIIKSNLFLSPSCGLGTQNETIAAKVFSNLSKVSSILQREFKIFS